ncbi:hypothetical protein RJ639_027060, partial [Escallonia herrerae]
AMEAGEKERLELTYGVHIDGDALYLACSIAVRYFSDQLPSTGRGYLSRQLPSTVLRFLCGGGNYSSSGLVLLQQNAAEFLEKACARVRNDIETNTIENYLDKAEYVLYRAFIELTEIKKEKDHAGRLWAPLVEIEYKHLTSMWDNIVGKSKQCLMSWEQSERRAQLRKELEEMCYILDITASGGTDLLFGVVQKLSALKTELLDMTREYFKQHITVSQRIVAEVASPIIGVPTSWLCNSWKPQLEGLEQRLAESLVVQRHATAPITNALSRPRHESDWPRPVGSFLFLCDYGYGSIELVEALAEQLYDDKDRIIRFNMSDFGDRHSSCCDRAFLGICPSESCNNEVHGVGQKLIEAVKNKPFCVLVFDNVQKANNYAIGVLVDILAHGRLVDCLGNTVDFSKTLIFLTSDIGKYQLEPPGYCKCLESIGDHPIKEELQRSWSERPHECSYLPVLRESTLRCWLQENVVPVLFEMVAEAGIDDLSTIYIDTLVGTDELSYRLNTGGPVDDKDFANLKLWIQEWRIVFRQEKEHVSKIYSLDSKYSELKNTLNGEATSNFALVGERALEFFTNLADVSLMWQGYKLGLLKSLHEVDLRQEEEQDVIVRYIGEGLQQRLTCSLGENNQALDTIAEAILQCIDEPQHMPLQPARSLLFLGLTSSGKADLEKGLAKVFATGDGTDMDNHYLRNSNADKHSLKLPEAIRMRPYCILLVDEVEKAHVSSFSTLISVLDHGMLRDGDGRVFDFTNTIVVIMSRLGNKEMLCKLVGYTHGVFVQDDGAKEGERHFRNELLNHVDEIVLANPYAQEQLIKVARLSMRSGPHLEENDAFDLFVDSNDPNAKLGPLLALSRLSQGLIDGCNKSTWNGAAISVVWLNLKEDYNVGKIHPFCGRFLSCLRWLNPISGSGKVYGSSFKKRSSYDFEAEEVVGIMVQMQHWEAVLVAVNLGIGDWGKRRGEVKKECQEEGWNVENSIEPSLNKLDADEADGEAPIMSATDYTDAVHNFIMSQKLTSLLGNFPEVLQVSDILEHNDASNEQNMATTHSQKCCEKLVAEGAVDMLLTLIRSVSRSLPDQEKPCSLPHLTEELNDSRASTQAILLEFLRNKEEGYFIASELLEKICLNRRGVIAVRSSPALLKRLHSHVEDLTKKATKEKRNVRSHVKWELKERRLRKAVKLLDLITNG